MFSLQDSSCFSLVYGGFFPFCSVSKSDYRCFHLLFDTLHPCFLKAAHILLNSCWMPPFHKFLMRAPTNVPETIRALKVGAHSLCTSSAI